MPDQGKRRHGPAGRQPVATAPFHGFPINVWRPAFAWSAEFNARLHEGIVKLSSEWQDFSARRMKEDVGLLQQLGASRSPEQVWAAYLLFWQKAAEDYSQELGRTAQLTSSLMNRSMADMHRQMAKAATEIVPLEEAT